MTTIVYYCSIYIYFFINLFFFCSPVWALPGILALAQGLACGCGPTMVDAGPRVKPSSLTGRVGDASPGKAPVGGSLDPWSLCSLGFLTKWQLHPEGERPEPEREAAEAPPGSSRLLCRTHGPAQVHGGRQAAALPAGFRKSLWGQKYIFFQLLLKSTNCRRPLRG